MTKRMGFLPPAETAVGTSSCYLVWLPDDPVYRAAFWGSYSGLSDYWMWDELDGQRRAEITASWNEAIWKTLECLDMACLENITALLEEIRDAIYLTSCCGSESPGEPRTSDIVPGVGDAPAFWGDEPVTDWDDYHDLLCGAAHAYVELLKSMAEDAKAAVNSGAILIGVAAFILAMLSGAGILLYASYLVAGGALAGLLALVGTAALDSVPDDIESARDDIVCAIMSGSGLGSAVAIAVGETAWSALFRFVDYDSAQATMLNGGADEQYLEADRTQSCPCDVPDYFLEVINGTYLGDNLWQSTTIPEGRSIIQFYLWVDTSKTEAVSGTILLSNDSVYGTRLYTGPSRTYRLDNESLTALYLGQTYPPSTAGVHRVTVQHTGTTPFTIEIALSDVS